MECFEEPEMLVDLESIRKEAIEEGYMNGHKFDIERFIKDKYHIIIKREELASDISGKLKMEDGVWVMTVNSQHPVVRQRYTLGHELGHYLNHRDSKNHSKIQYFLEVVKSLRWSIWQINLLLVC